MGHTTAATTGRNISTVGVDISDLTLTVKNEEVVLSTWDFGGQREYYATHQYFLSRRSLYLVVWNLTKGERGLDEIQQWLVNIQVRQTSHHTHSTSARLVRLLNKYFFVCIVRHVLRTVRSLSSAHILTCSSPTRAITWKICRDRLRQSICTSQVRPLQLLVLCVKVKYMCQTQTKLSVQNLRSVACLVSLRMSK